MPKSPPEGSPNIFPALRYQDGAAAVAWLATVFGFEKKVVVPGPEGSIAHAQLKLGPGVIMLGSGKHGPGDNPWDKVKQGVYVYVADVDSHYARAKAAGAEIVRELEDTDHGSREYSVRDLEGHLWSFGTYHPGDMTSTPDIPLPFQLSRMITSFWVPQAIYAAAALGIPDLLADGPRRSEDLARAAGAHPGALHRLLRALVVIELLSETDDGSFALTPLGACLRSGTRDSVRSWALLMGGQAVWHSWARLADCVRTGDPVPKLDGTGTFDRLAADPEQAAIFNQSMVELTRHLAGAVAAAYDFSGMQRLVDVGGGYGALLPPILAAYPDLHAVVFDLPHCREGAIRLFEKARLAGRAEFVGGSFFETVPAGADAYLLKSVIHDWDDERGRAILGNCRAAMGKGARLLLVEPLMPDRLGSSPLDAMLAATDLNMLVVAGGRERTVAEYRTLLEAAGLHLAKVVPTPAAFSVLEARLA